MISSLTRAKVAAGSFFLQASWSFEKMQGLGFAAAISPALKEIYSGDDEAAKKALKRHLVFYNAHPYMASPVLGASIAMEERVRDGNAPVDAAVKFKKMVTGAYGAIGDTFFWGSIRPLASVLGVVATLLWGAWGPVVFLIVYNAPHLWMRFVGLGKGIELDSAVIGYISSLGLLKWAERGRRAVAVVLGVVAAYSASALVPGLSGGVAGPGLTGAAVGLAIGLSLLVCSLHRRGVKVQTLLYIALVPLVIYGLVIGLP